MNKYNFKCIIIIEGEGKERYKDMNTKTHEEATWAMKLQEILGQDYRVHYDVCESGFTEIYYKDILVKRVLDEEMNGNLNVYDYTVNAEWKMAHGVN